MVMAIAVGVVMMVTVMVAMEFIVGAVVTGVCSRNGMAVHLVRAVWQWPRGGRHGRGPLGRGP